MIRAMSPSPVEAARALAPRAAELAAEAERERRLSAGFSTELAEAGLYRLCVPASLGGGEAPPAELLGAVEALAEGDAAAGWCVAVCATAGMLAAYLDESSAGEVYGDPANVVGGVFAPSGRAPASGETLSVSGRWRFASNVGNCNWLMGGCIVFDGDRPRRLDGGRPDIRLALMPASDVEVIDTWSVSGLRATGSHDIIVEGLAVPAARSASLISEAPRESGPLYAFPPFGLLAASIAAVALGIARAALGDLSQLAGVKTPTLSTRKLAERPATQAGVARAEAGVRAARSLLFAAVAEAWDAANSGGEIPIELRAGLRLASTNAVEAAAAAVDAAYTLGGGSVIYETSPLQRRFRDVHAATQHMLVAPATWELSGRSLLGLEFDSSQL
jgi:alkylation response protein AidB-like acyl-CoA dehydrogenase